MPPVAEIDDDALWVPEGEDYGGLNDRLMVVGRQHAPAALSQLQELVARPQALRAAMEQELAAGRSEWNAESFLLLVLRRAGLAEKVRRFPRTMFLARGAGDATRWSHGSFNTELGLFVKYGDEYEAAKRTLWYIAHYGIAGPGNGC